MLNDNTLVIGEGQKTISFNTVEAKCNIRAVATGYELTFSCHTEKDDSLDYNPHLEVTIFQKDEPSLVTGNEWSKQPAYIDEDGFDNMTNYYQWSHEGLENFSVSILEHGDNTVKALIRGEIDLNAQDNIEPIVSVLAYFKIDAELGRGVC